MRDLYMIRMGKPLFALSTMNQEIYIAIIPSYVWSPVCYQAVAWTSVDME